MSNIQKQFNVCGSGDFFLSAGEYEGPLHITRPCIVDGKMATLWAPSGPVLIIDSPNVVIKNLRVEVTGSADNGDALIAIATNQQDTKLIAVDVNGTVSGFQTEAVAWNLPPVVTLGTFAAGKENSFVVELDAATDAELVNGIRDVVIRPMKLAAGKNRLIIETSSMRDNTILYGEILVKTSVTRRIYVTGKAQNGAPEHNDARPVINTPVVSNPVQVDPPHEVIAPRITESNVEYIKRGQRIAIKDHQKSIMKSAYEHSGLKRQVDIDSYVFLLQGSGKVHRDDDLVFFGNQETADHAVKVSSTNDMPIVLVDIAKISSTVEKVSVCFSVYGDDPTQNFSLIESPIIRIFAGDRELYRYKLDDLQLEKTVVAVEVYRYKGEWKLNFVGAGYRAGLKHLCESFGVNIE